MSKRSSKRTARKKKRSHAARSAGSDVFSRSRLSAVIAVLTVATAAVAFTYRIWLPSPATQTTTAEPLKPPTESDRSTSGGPTTPTRKSPDTRGLLPTIPGLSEHRFDAVVRGVAEREDPVVDGWDSERINDQADKQLNSVGEMLRDRLQRNEEAAEKVAGHEFASPGIRPKDLHEAFSDPSLTVRRGEVDRPENSNYSGHSGFVKLLNEQAIPLDGLSDLHFKYKIIRVEQHARHAETVAYFQIDGRNDQRSVQVNSTWDCRWVKQDGATAAPKLVGIRVRDYEETEYRSAHGSAMFSDCTESVFRNCERFNEQLIFGIDYWTDRFDGAIARPAAGHGIAVGDVNGDGLEDLYLCQSPGLPNLLLIQNEDGTVRNRAADSGVDWLEGTRAALFADLDNDGDQDLVAVLGHKVVVQANDGTGKFEMKTIISTPSSLFAINALDYDGDADLDLFICGYTMSSGVNLEDVFANPMPFHDANNGAPNVMLRNEGGWSFTDVTEAVGLDENSMRFSYASAWDDFDSDGDLDAYVANDFGRNNLYRNDDGQFVDVAGESDVEDIGPGMSAAWGDYNNDGKADLYVSNMFSSAGNRTTHQAQFKPGLDAEQRRQFQRHARGNSLFENLGDGRFSDRSVDLGVTLGRWAWGSLFVDLNNDGWEDLYVTNGFITAGGGNDL